MKFNRKNVLVPRRPSKKVGYTSAQQVLDRSALFILKQGEPSFDPSFGDPSFGETGSCVNMKGDLRCAAACLFPDSVVEVMNGTSFADLVLGGAIDGCAVGDMLSCFVKDYSMLVCELQDAHDCATEAPGDFLEGFYNRVNSICEKHNLTNPLTKYIIEEE